MAKHLTRVLCFQGSVENLSHIPKGKYVRCLSELPLDAPVPSGPLKALETECPKCGAPSPRSKPPLKLDRSHFPFNQGSSLSFNLFPFFTLKFSFLQHKIAISH